MDEQTPRCKVVWCNTEASDYTSLTGPHEVRSLLCPSIPEGHPDIAKAVFFYQNNNTLKCLSLAKPEQTEIKQNKE